MEAMTGRAAGRLQGDDLIGEVLRNMEEGLFRIRGKALVPSIYRLYLSPDDYEPFRHVVPFVAGEIRTALDERLAQWNGSKRRLARGLLAKLDSSLPVYDLKTLDDQLNETLSTERLIAFLSTVFGVLATVLAGLGLYGVMAFVVARRTGELGLRMALGAPRLSVLWLVIREVLILLGGGLIVGVPSAYLLSRYVSSELFGVTPTDVWTGVAASALLGLIALVSGFVPARRASGIDPIAALRYE